MCVLRFTADVSLGLLHALVLLFLLLPAATETNSYCERNASSSCSASDNRADITVGPTLLQRALQTRGSGRLDMSNGLSEVAFPKIVHMTGKDESSFEWMSLWEAKNPGWLVNKLTNARQEQLMQTLCPDAYRFFERGEMLPVEVADISRLLALNNEGGLYSDNDVVPFYPVDAWPEQFGHPSRIHMLLGVEFVDPAAHELQLETWALGSVPDNPILQYVQKLIVRNLGTMNSTKANVIRRTGPIAFTEGVMEWLRRAGAEVPPMSSFNEGQGHLFKLEGGPRYPELRVLILPYRALGFPGAHGPLVADGNLSEHLVEHDFRSSWKF